MTNVARPPHPDPLPPGVEREGTAELPTYTRWPVALVRGEGSTVWDASGKSYLDLFLKRVLQDSSQAFGFEDVFLVGLMRFIDLLNPPEGSVHI